jgi:hypothetical protein
MDRPGDMVFRLLICALPPSSTPLIFARICTDALAGAAHAALRIERKR